MECSGPIQLYDTLPRRRWSGPTTEWVPRACAGWEGGGGGWWVCYPRSPPQFKQQVQTEMEKRGVMDPEPRGDPPRDEGGEAGPGGGGRLKEGRGWASTRILVNPPNNGPLGTLLGHRIGPLRVGGGTVLGMQFFLPFFTGLFPSKGGGTLFGGRIRPPQGAGRYIIRAMALYLGGGEGLYL